MQLKGKKKKEIAEYMKMKRRKMNLLNVRKRISKWIFSSSYII